MQQVNFRLSKEEKEILQQIARTKGISIAELAKNAVLNEIKKDRIEIAFSLLKEGKIGKKRAFIFSSLTYNEFTLELNRRNIQEICSQEAFELGFEIALNLDAESFRHSS